jgi:protein arginine kinase activator
MDEDGTALHTMICQTCNKNPATVHVTEIVQPKGQADGSAPGGPPTIQEQHLCEDCAQAANLPHTPVLKKSVSEIWKLLQDSAKRGRREAGVTCPECGMSLLEFRQRGRLGCARDYEVFAPHLRELFERIHGATRHVGRGPGLDADMLEVVRRRGEIQRKLEDAIRDEAYEQAARLRDELRGLEGR